MIQSLAWLNGKLTPLDSISINPQDRGFLLGDGLFETILAQNGKLVCFTAHWERLLHGATLFRLSIPYSAGQIQDAIDRTLLQNNLSNQQASLRLTLTRGVGPRGLLPPTPAQPMVMITASPYNPPSTPVRAILSDFHIDQFSPLTQVKHLGYQLPILARMEAHDQQADEALLFNHEGRLATATCANVFILKDNQIHTPPLSDGALPGVTRGVLLNSAKQNQLPLQVKSISSEEVLACDGLFFTNSLIGIRPCSSLEDRELVTDHVLVRHLQRVALGAD